MAIYTWAEAIKLAPTKLDQMIHYGAMEYDPMFLGLPFQNWPGGQSVTWYQTHTLPTTSWRTVTDAMTSTAPTRLPRVGSLKEAYTQMQVPPLHEGAVSGSVNQYAANIRDMSRSIGKEVRQTIIDGHTNTVAIGATAATKGVDKVVLGPGFAAGLVYLKFDDTADTIQLSTDGTTYGTAVDVSSDLKGVAVYDGVDTTKYIYLWFDFSDSDTGGDWTTTNAATGLTLTSSKEPDGLLTYVYPSQRVDGTLTGAPSNAGDAAALAQLDWLLDMVPGADFFITSKRTRRAIKSLLSGSADIVDHWKGMKLARNQLAYEGIPIFASSGVPITGEHYVAGTATATALSSISAVRMANGDGEGGFMCYNWNEGPAATMITDEGNEQKIRLPIYSRDLGEVSTTLTDHFYRMTGHFCPVLKNTQAMATVWGINN